MLKATKLRISNRNFFADLLKKSGGFLLRPLSLFSLNIRFNFLFHDGIFPQIAWMEKKLGRVHFICPAKIISLREGDGEGEQSEIQTVIITFDVVFSWKLGWEEWYLMCQLGYRLLGKFISQSCFLLSLFYCKDAKSCFPRNNHLWELLIGRQNVINLLIFMRAGK